MLIYCKFIQELQFIQIILSIIHFNIIYWQHDLKYNQHHHLLTDFDNVFQVLLLFLFFSLSLPNQYYPFIYMNRYSQILYFHYFYLLIQYLLYPYYQYFIYQFHQSIITVIFLSNYSIIIYHFHHLFHSLFFSLLFQQFLLIKLINEFIQKVNIIFVFIHKKLLNHFEFFCGKMVH